MSIALSQNKPNFLFLFLLISFGSVNAILFTPALPEISQYFFVKENVAGFTVTIYLIGYALGQLIYGPLANGYGRRPSIIIGCGLAVFGTFACIISGLLHSFILLIVARFIMALGGSAGLNMSFTLVADCYDLNDQKRLTAFLIMSFAVTLGLGVAIGGFLSEYFGWQSCFYASFVYSILLLLMAYKNKETAVVLDKKALIFGNIIKEYQKTLANIPLLFGGLLIGITTSFVYAFAALAPFLAFQVIHLSPSEYGLWNIIPNLGTLGGSYIAAACAKRWLGIKAACIGLAILVLGVLLMFFAFMIHDIYAYTLFLPLTIIYIGTSFIYPNISSIVIQSTEDKSGNSAMMSCLNMSTATIVILILNVLAISSVNFLPYSYMILAAIGLLIFSGLIIIKKTWATTNNNCTQ